MAAVEAVAGAGADLVESLERAVLLREGRVAFEGPSHEAVAAYRRLLAGERDPEERVPGLKEWVVKSRESRARACSMQPARIDGSCWRASRSQSCSMSPPRRHCRRRGLPGSCTTTAGRWSRPVRFRPPCSAGATRPVVSTCVTTSSDRRSRAAGSVSASTSRTLAGETAYHSLDDAVVFAVYSEDGTRGLVRLEGRWSLAAGPEHDGQVPSSNTRARSTLNPGLRSRSDSTPAGSTS